MLATCRTGSEFKMNVTNINEWLKDQRQLQVTKESRKNITNAL